MKISEYIRALEELQAKHGDLEVHTMSTSVPGKRVPSKPRVANAYLYWGEELNENLKPKFLHPQDSAQRIGEKLIRV